MLDFDGVFVDSTKECILIAIQAYEEIKFKSEINFSQEQYQKLFDLRPMVRGAKEYIKAIEIVLEKRI